MDRRHVEKVGDSNVLLNCVKIILFVEFWLLLARII